MLLALIASRSCVVSTWLGVCVVMHNCVCVCLWVLCYVPGSTVVSSSFAVHTRTHEQIVSTRMIQMHLQVARSTWSIDIFLYFESV